MVTQVERHQDLAARRLPLIGVRLNNRMPEHAQDALAADAPSPDTLARVTELLHRHPLIDGHNDFMWEAREQ